MELVHASYLQLKKKKSAGGEGKVKHSTKILLNGEEATMAGIRLRSLCIPPVSTVPHGGLIKNLVGKRWGLDLGMEPSITWDAC